MVYTSEEWRAVIAMLVGLGFTIVHQDRETGAVTVQVPQ